MSLEKIGCPACRQTIVRPVISPGNKIRCRNCAHVFSPPEPETFDAEQSATTDANAPAQPLPLGAQPRPASFGLLGTAAWGILIVGVGAAATQLYEMLSLSAQFGVLRMPSYVALGAISVVEHVLLGLICLYMVRCMGRLDARASWIAWRSGALKQPMTEPAGSSLPFILPLCATGGVMLMYGLSMLEQGSDALLNSVKICAPGLVILLCGLACGDVRRFLWRMQQSAQAIPSRDRSAEIGLADVQPVKQVARRTTSAVLIGLALAFLLIASIGFGLGFIGFLATSARWLALSLILFVGVVGGIYSIYRLANTWADMEQAWRRAALSIGKSAVRVPGERATTLFYSAARLLGISLSTLSVGSLVFGFSEIQKMMGGNMMMSLLMTVGLIGFAVSFAWWQGDMKQDTYAFARATSRFCRAPQSASRLEWRLATGLLITLAVRLGLSIVTVAPMIGTLTSGNVVKGNMLLLTIFIMVESALMTFIAITLPMIGLALILVDFSSAARNLECCVETPLLDNSEAQSAAEISSAGVSRG
ncbi:MAG TPA: hypothetical protein VEK08_14870 [Planctomycetota bacterium]|nr:hypothetical protein [Planctomycetota bacterium]